MNDSWQGGREEGRGGSSLSLGALAGTRRDGLQGAALPLPEKPGPPQQLVPGGDEPAQSAPPRRSALAQQSQAGRWRPPLKGTRGRRGREARTAPLPP